MWLFVKDIVESNGEETISQQPDSPQTIQTSYIVYLPFRITEVSQRPSENVSTEETVTGRVQESQSSQFLDHSPEQASPPIQESSNTLQTHLVDQSPTSPVNVEASSTNHEDQREPIPPEEPGNILRRLRSLSESVSENSQRIENACLSF